MKLIDIANAAARRFKGKDYAVDPDITTIDLVLFFRRRVTLLARGFFRSFLLAPGTSRAIFIDHAVEIRNPRHTRLGRGVMLSKGVVLDGLSKGGIRIGDTVSIGQYSIIETSGVISSLGDGFSIGAGSGIGAYSFVGAAGGVHIGDNVIMGQRVSFHSENHNFSDASRDIKFQGVTRKGIRVERNCWVGANVVFLDGSHVEEGCVIAAGAVVSGRYPRNSVIAGVPAVVKKPRC